MSTCKFLFADTSSWI